MAAATLILVRIPGVKRPAIAAVIPAAAHPVVLLDIGANADCRPEHLLQFGWMGAAYARATLGLEHPSIGLLNIGEEPSKGSQLAQETHALMAASLEGFLGNVEGRDIPSGAADIVVTDGFTGNVALKLLEGTAAMLMRQLREAVTATPLRSLAAAALKPAFRELRDRLDPERYGGAPLLGVNGVCIIGHGSSSARAIASGIAVTARAVRADLTDMIASSLSALNADS